MRSQIKFPTRRTFAFTAAIVSIGFTFFASSATADDRFVVPTSPSSNDSSPAPSPPPPSPPPPPSGGNDSSYSPPSSDSGRFNVPVPNNPPSSSNYIPGSGQSGGGYYSGNRGHGSYSNPFPYWGGYYYWDGDYYYWGGHRYYSESGRFGRYPFSLGYTERYNQTSNEKSVSIFFPPAAPPIGAPIPPKQAPGLQTPAPQELAKFIYEPFYAPLSTRLAEQDLSRKLITRLDNYKAKRSALQTELQKKLDSLTDAMPADRIQQLETFAREQTPRIAELEATAEQLRSDLLRGGLIGIFSGTGDWNETRRWALGGETLPQDRQQTLVFEFLVMRAAVYYQEGLSPAQRRLLREIAMELQVEAFKPKTEEPSKNETSLMFFSPETSRIGVPDDLPPDLSAKIATYQSEKKAIKTELRNTLYSQDRAAASRRFQVLKQLAESQASRIAVLDGLADDIRACLSRLPKPPGPTTPPAFPAELAKRISAYQKEKLAIQKLLQSKLDEVRERLSITPEGFNVTRKASDDRSRITFNLQTPPGLPDYKRTLIRQAIDDLNKQNAQRFDALNKEREVIREEVARFAAVPRDASGENSVRSLLRDFFTALREEESWQPYKDYQTAVYQPGLSPEQRRLLFEVALEKLALPLPDGEFQQ